MKLVLQIALGVFIALAAMNIIEYLIVRYQVEIAIESLNASMKEVAESIPKPLQRHTRVISPRSKSDCLLESGNVYNETYLTCRQGQKLTIEFDPNTGKERLLRSEPVIRHTL